MSQFSNLKYMDPFHIHGSTVISMVLYYSYYFASDLFIVARNRVPGVFKGVGKVGGCTDSIY